MFKQTIGSKQQVYNGTARKTSGGLTKERLMKNSKGRIVSRRQHELGKLRFKQNNLKPKTKEELASIRPN